MMDLTPEQFARLEQLYVEALNLSLQLRTALLDRVRDEDGEAIAGRLRGMLAVHSDETESMFEPAVGPFPEIPRPSAFKDGDVILKRFRIIQLLGRGGMGDVAYFVGGADRSRTGE